MSKKLRHASGAVKAAQPAIRWENRSRAVVAAGAGAGPDEYALCRPATSRFRV